MSNAQVGINTTDPQATLDINYSPDSDVAHGLLFPRLTVEQLEIEIDKYDEKHSGTVIFIRRVNEGDDTEVIQGAKSQTADIKDVGYYYYSHKYGKWLMLEREPWFSSDTDIPAKSNVENIYHRGSVGIGTDELDGSAILNVTSTTKGVLIPRLTKTERDAILTPSQGLLIYNTTSNCLNYFTEIAGWLSMCGSYEPAEFVLDCNKSLTGLNVSSLKQGIGLTEDITYRIPVIVNQAGSFSAAGLGENLPPSNTLNGYAFQEEGVFTELGNQFIELKGQGTPISSGTNTLRLQFNGIRYAYNGNENFDLRTCLNDIIVDSSDVSYSIQCGSISVLGEYKVGVNMDSSNYIEVTVNVSNPGNIVFETNTINGIYFSSRTVSLNSGTQIVRLYAYGRPLAVNNNQVFSFNTLDTTNPSCSFSVNIKSTKGTFEDPAKNCSEILEYVPSSTDGLYWVKGDLKYQTYCDMSNGGWTLVSSKSEKAIFDSNRSIGNYYLNLSAQKAINIVTTINGIFNEYDFSLPASAVKLIATPMQRREIRYTIKQEGQGFKDTGGLDPASIIAPINDIWSKENFINATYIANYDPVQRSLGGNYLNHSAYGRFFGFALLKNLNNTKWKYSKTSSRGQDISDITQEAVYDFQYAVPGVNEENFYTGFYGGLNYMGTKNEYLTYTYPNDYPIVEARGQSFTFQEWYVNDLFGVYMNHEWQLNHHLGTCSNSNDDVAGAYYCPTGFANWRPHKFNPTTRNGNEYYGRILQYWIK